MPDSPRSSASRTMLIGAGVVGFSILLFGVAILVGAKLGRFIAAPALVGILLGACIALNGLLDRWWGK